MLSTSNPVHLIIGPHPFSSAAGPAAARRNLREAGLRVNRIAVAS
jgi:hypothetical protein